MTWIPELAGGGSGVSLTPAQLHDTTHSPVALYQLDGDIKDYSGNALDLTLNVGTEAYGPGIAPGIQAFAFDGATNLVHLHDALLTILGALTIEILVYLPKMVSGGTQGVIAYNGPKNGGQPESDNILYIIDILDAHNGFLATVETGLGDDQSIAPSPVLSIQPGRWNHIAHTRAADGAHNVYLNGQLRHTGSEGLPTGGSAATLSIGAISVFGGPVAFYQGSVQSAKIIASELSAAQVLAEARRTLPPDVRP